MRYTNEHQQHQQTSSKREGERPLRQTQWDSLRQELHAGMHPLLSSSIARTCMLHGNTTASLRCAQPDPPSCRTRRGRESGRKSTLPTLQKSVRILQPFQIGTCKERNPFRRTLGKKYSPGQERWWRRSTPNRGSKWTHFWCFGWWYRAFSLRGDALAAGEEREQLRRECTALQAAAGKTGDEQTSLLQEDGERNEWKPSQSQSFLFSTLAHNATHTSIR